MDKIKKTFSFVSFFAIGSIVGAGIALLMAPQSGERTRSFIRNKGEEWKGKAIEVAEGSRKQIEQTVEDLTSQTKDRLSTLKDKGQQIAEDQKERLQEGLRAIS
jgi:gas vesicle protein